MWSTNKVVFFALALLRLPGISVHISTWSSLQCTSCMVWCVTINMCRIGSLWGKRTKICMSKWREYEFSFLSGPVCSSISGIFDVSSTLNFRLSGNQKAIHQASTPQAYPQAFCAAIVQSFDCHGNCSRVVHKQFVASVGFDWAQWVPKRANRGPKFTEFSKRTGYYSVYSRLMPLAFVCFFRACCLFEVEEEGEICWLEDAAKYQADRFRYSRGVWWTFPKLENLHVHNYWTFQSAD